jgi:hypothetical protein
LLQQRGIGVDELPRFDRVLCDDAANGVRILRGELLCGIGILGFINEQGSGTIGERACSG